MAKGQEDFFGGGRECGKVKRGRKRRKKTLRRVSGQGARYFLVGKDAVKWTRGGGKFLGQESRSVGEQGKLERGRRTFW